MDLEPHTKALLGLWLTLPLTVLSYWLAWERVPARMAASLTVGIVSFAVVLVVFTAVNVLVLSMRPDRARPALVVSYVAVILVFLVSNGALWNSVP